MRISYKNLRRYREIVHVLVKYGFSYLIEKLNIEGVAYKIPMTNPSEEIKNMSTGEKVRRVFEELGPTYVKLGQILSTRTDLLDPDIIDELVKLRDNVEAFSTDIAKTIFINELGMSVDEVFEEFNDKPIAAASIGQVYEATLKTGEDVIVKIQRPNIEETIKSDLDILQGAATAITDLNKDIEFDLSKIVEEFQTQLIRELDYNFEAINAIKFKKIFKDSTEVYIPEIYSEYTTKRILVMEKIVGVKLSDAEYIKRLGWDTNEIGQIGIRSLFKQVFENGFFHADPHPGNIFVTSSRSISYIDFGMIGIIDKKTLSTLNKMALAVVEKNVDKIIHLLMEMDAIESNVDVESLRSDMMYIIHYYYDVPLEKISIAGILNELFRFFRRHKVVMPTQLATLAKTIITLEGTARELNPDFSASSIGAEFVKHYYMNELNPERIFAASKTTIENTIMDLKTLPKQLRVILRQIEKNNIRLNIEDVKLPRIEELLSGVSTQISLSLVLAAMIVGSSLIIASPNIDDNIWVGIMAGTGFFISFIIGILLLIKTIRNEYKKK